MNRRLIVTTGTSTVVGAADGSSYTFEGDFTYDLEDLDSYVQVKLLYAEVPGKANLPAVTVTFRDPSAQVIVNAYVKVPFGDNWAVGKVVATGRGADAPIATVTPLDLISVLQEQVL